jgi:alanyl-tRNA synthetase
MESKKTLRLFEQEPYQTEFQAEIIDIKSIEQQTEVVLNQTCFYPESGGQPCDLGEIDHIPVMKVYEEGNTIFHLLDNSLKEKSSVIGKINWERRFDHMQQHSGQHILSQAFVRNLKATTIGFRLCEKYSTIDLDISVLSDSDVRQVEIEANRVVMSNKPVLIRECQPDDVKDIPFRKPPVVKNKIRVVEIEGYDLVGCCGTHVRYSGEIGLIKIIRIQRYKGGHRVEFLCGWRALSDYCLKSDVVKRISHTMTSGNEDLPELIAQLKQQHKETTNAYHYILQEKLDLEAEMLLSDAENVGLLKIVRKIFVNREPSEIEWLAKKLSKREQTVALLGLSSDRGYLFFSCHSGLSINVNVIMKKACQLIGGKGGGGSTYAQGSSSDVSKIDHALDAVYKDLSVIHS